ncbi:Sporulation protein YdcC [Paenibacillus sp. CECT 9249]|uniref:outer membrane lipoprotein-sorting protein n=1 Tax=Paenibacillus sp. CECT 9249 TaxID=2845385 RepID=UPI001E56947B|nr:outer membrane lipoprotein-sorting protein [Paenibacillus sp. CECT 9249]CAH0122456.1 Sporulation protein YdcC [Paenibacillus sp. CECT 9249]
MRRITWIAAIVMCAAIMLAGCGKKDAAAVLKDLDHVVSKLESYQGTGTMMLHTGQQPQEYQVDVWYQNPSYYRIALKNAKKDITQIVLRNDEGVFVLTPSLNKSFRFQSDWPEKQGQVYLYQTLIHSILADSSRQFATEKDSYVFDVAANYQTASLVRQKIWLSKENYAPQQVQVSDANANVVVEVKFNQFEFDKKFDKDSFEMQRNMTSMNVTTLPTVSQVDENGNPIDDGSVSIPQDQLAGKTQELGSFGIIEPAYTPEGVKLHDTQQIKNAADHSVLLRYSGTYNYTLRESRPQDMEVSMTPGTLLFLGHTVGHLSGDELKTLAWTYDGIEYRLTSADLPQDEMINIAASLQDQPGK